MNYADMIFVKTLAQSTRSIANIKTIYGSDVAKAVFDLRWQTPAAKPNGIYGLKKGIFLSKGVV